MTMKCSLAGGLTLAATLGLGAPALALPPPTRNASHMTPAASPPLGGQANVLSNRGSVGGASNPARAGSIGTSPSAPTATNAPALAGPGHGLAITPPSSGNAPTSSAAAPPASAPPSPSTGTAAAAPATVASAPTASSPAGGSSAASGSASASAPATAAGTPSGNVSPAAMATHAGRPAIQAWARAPRIGRGAAQPPSHDAPASGSGSAPTAPGASNGTSNGVTAAPAPAPVLASNTQ